MSPVVTAILKGKDRLVTKRFADFQQHFGFAQDFCNPASGNEKGNVESNNKHLKRKILSLISIHNLSFTDLDAFNVFLTSLCLEHKNKDFLAFSTSSDRRSSISRIRTDKAVNAETLPY